MSSQPSQVGMPTDAAIIQDMQDAAFDEVDR